LSFDGPNTGPFFLVTAVGCAARQWSGVNYTKEHVQCGIKPTAADGGRPSLSVPDLPSHPESVGPGKVAALFQLGPRLCCFCKTVRLAQRSAAPLAIAAVVLTRKSPRIGTNTTQRAARISHQRRAGSVAVKRARFCGRYRLLRLSGFNRGLFIRRRRNRRTRNSAWYCGCCAWR
jgi:hypothetical protein